MKNIIKALITLCVIGCALALVFVARSRLSAAKKPVIDAKYISTVELRDIKDAIEASGDVAPKFQLDVKSEVGGKVKRLLVVAGQQVKKGDVLCEIDDTDLQNQRATILTDIAGRQIQVEKSQLDFDRAAELYKTKLVTKEAYDNAKTDLAQAKNNLERVQRQLRTTEDQILKAQVISPLDGTILNVNVNEGQVVVAAASVNSGTTLMTMADLNKLIVNSHINQVDVGRISLDQEIEINLASVKGETMPGAIRFIAPVATTKNGVKGFALEATINEPSSLLRPGMTVNMTMPVAKVSQAPSVPLSAVFKGDGEEHLVYLLLSGDKTEKRTVTLGVSNLDYAEVKSGVANGDRVLTVEPSFFEKKP